MSLNWGMLECGPSLPETTTQREKGTNYWLVQHGWISNTLKKKKGLGWWVSTYNTPGVTNRNDLVAFLVSLPTARAKEHFVCSKAFVAFYSVTYVFTSSRLKKWARHLNGYLTKGYVGTVSKHIKRRSAFILTKVQMRYCFRPTRKAKIKSTVTFWRGYGPTGTITHCRGGCKRVQALWALMHILSCGPGIPILQICSREKDLCSQKDTHSSLTIIRNWKPKYWSTWE